MKAWRATTSRTPCASSNATPKPGRKSCGRLSVSANLVTRLNRGNPSTFCSEIETAEGNPAAARAAWAQARDAYLAYRRQGGYAQQGDGKLVEHVVGLLAQQKFDEIQPLFDRMLNDRKHR